MKLLPNKTFIGLFVTLSFAALVSAEPAREAKTYPYNGFYVLVAPCGTTELRIELKSPDDDRILNSRRVLSRYMEPEYEVRDITGDGIGEILVYTKGGGPGIATKQLTIYAVRGGKLVEAATFELEKTLSVGAGGCKVSLPDGTQAYMPVKESKSRGSVNFFPDGIILYSFACAQREDTELALDFKTEEYRFNSATAIFELQAPDM